jgi:branched-subunit amino acid aminotransferase/4-amino-4-deoxychorismate lyase
MADLQATEKIWMNGEFVDWADATVHVGVHGLHYGSGVFEGIRAYETPKGTAIFRLSDHLQRLHDSARLLRMTIPYSVEDLRKASLELVAVNKQPSCYVRPIAFYGYGSLGVPPRDNPVNVAIMCWPWGAYLGEEGMTKGVRAKISTFQGVRSLPELDAGGAGSRPRRIRRGDLVDREGLYRRLLRRERVHRQGRCSVHTAARDGDSAWDHT